jgi:hypothetical protein
MKTVDIVIFFLILSRESHKNRSYAELNLINLTQGTNVINFAKVGMVQMYQLHSASFHKLIHYSMSVWAL